MTKISIDQKECIGCNLCGSYVPEVFKLDEMDYKAKVNENGNLVPTARIELSAEQLEKVKEAVKDCPVEVIELSE